MAAACFRARLAGDPTPAGERTARVLAGYRRTAADRGRGQARPFVAADLAAVLATCHQPRRRGRGREARGGYPTQGRAGSALPQSALRGCCRARRLVTPGASSRVDSEYVPGGRVDAMRRLIGRR